MEYKKVAIGMIDTKSPCWDRFTIAFNHDIEELTESIHQFGLINPIKVWKKAKKEGYWLITGFKRLNAIIKLGWETIPALIYAEKELTEEKALELALCEIYYNIALSDTEKALFLAKMNRCFDFNFQQITRKYSKYLNLTSSEGLIEDYIKIGNLPKKWLMSLHAERISLDQIRSLLIFKQNDADALFGLLDTYIILNKNESFQFFEIAKDLSLLRKCSIKELFEKPELREIYKNNKLHKKKRGEELLLLLRKMRFPKIHQAYEEFQQNLKKTNLPGDVQVQYPPNFEGSWLRIVINSTGRKELAQQLEDIKKSVSKGKFTALFKNI